jgi:hypothetical protein
MAIDETRDDGAALQIEHRRVAASMPSKHRLVRPDADNPSTPDLHGLVDRNQRVHGNDSSVMQDQVGLSKA